VHRANLPERRPGRPHRRYRTLFISDVHLGSRNCQVELFLDFLERVRAERIFLVGDVVDGWKLRRSWHWPPSHNTVIQKLLRLARKGVEITYVPGNHDELLRDYCGYHFGGIEVTRDAVHVTADGRRLLVTHGDHFDALFHHTPWLTAVGDGAHYLAMVLNTCFNWIRRRLGLGYWSLATYLKHRVRGAVRYMEKFEGTLAAEARRRGFDGVVCGHIHQPGVREVDGVLYCNSGDWVENCTALAESADGTLEVLHWGAVKELAPARPVPAAAA